MKLIAIDPGLDVAGAAIFDLEAFRRTAGDMRGALESLVGAVDLTTNSSDPMHVRLAELAQDLGSILVEFQVQAAYIETPATEGGYVGKGESRRGPVNRMYEARGALLCTLGLHRVRTFQYQAGTRKKEERFTVLENVLNSMGRKLPRGPRGGERQDVWDAIWIGAWALTTRIQDDLKSSGETPERLVSP